MKFYTVDTKKEYDIYLSMWRGELEGYGPDVLSDNSRADMTDDGFVLYDADYAWIGKQDSVDDLINWLEDEVAYANENPNYIGDVITSLREDDVEKGYEWFLDVIEYKMNQETYENIKDMLK